MSAPTGAFAGLLLILAGVWLLLQTLAAGLVDYILGLGASKSPSASSSSSSSSPSTSSSSPAPHDPGTARQITSGGPG